MAGGLLNVYWVLTLLCVLQMVETVCGARAPFAGAHISSQFPASGVSQTGMVDVSIHSGNWYIRWGRSQMTRYLLSTYSVPSTEVNPGICQGTYTVDKNPCPDGVNSFQGGWLNKRVDFRQ